LRMSLKEEMQDFKPEKVQMRGGFEPFKMKAGACRVNYARIEKSTFNDNELYQYELEVCDHPEFSGRRLWGRFNLSSAAMVKRLVYVLWAIDIACLPDPTLDEDAYYDQLKENLDVVSEKLVTMTVRVDTWVGKKRSFDEATSAWVSTDQDQQNHKIVGIAEGDNGESTASSPDF